MAKKTAILTQAATEHADDQFVIDNLNGAKTSDAPEQVTSESGKGMQPDKKGGLAGKIDNLNAWGAKKGQAVNKSLMGPAAKLGTMLNGKADSDAPEQVKYETGKSMRPEKRGGLMGKIDNLNAWGAKKGEAVNKSLMGPAAKLGAMLNGKADSNAPEQVKYETGEGFSSAEDETTDLEMSATEDGTTSGTSTTSGDQDGKEEAPAPEAPKALGYPAMDAFVSKLFTKRFAMLAEYEKVLGYGSKDACEVLYENMEDDVTALKQEKAEVHSAFMIEFAADKSTLQSKVDGLASQAKLLGSEDKNTADAATEAEKELADKKGKDQTYNQILSFEFSQIDKIMSTVQSGGEIEDSMSSTLTEGDKIEGSGKDALKTWAKKFLGKVKTSHMDYETEYEKVRGYGSKEALESLKWKLEADLTKFKEEWTRAEQHFDGQDSDKQQMIASLKKTDPAKAEMMEAELNQSTGEEREVRALLDEKKDEADADLDELELLKDNMMDGLAAEKLNRVDLKTLKDNVDKLSSEEWERGLQTRIKKTYTDFSDEYNRAKGYGDKFGLEMLGRRLDLSKRELAREVNLGHQHLKKKADDAEEKESQKETPVQRVLSKARADGESIDRAQANLNVALETFDNLKEAISSDDVVLEEINVNVQKIDNIEGYKTWAGDLVKRYKEQFKSAKSRAKNVRASGDYESTKNESRLIKHKKKALDSERSKTDEQFKKKFTEGLTKDKVQAKDRKEDTKEIDQKIKDRTEALRKAKQQWDGQLDHASKLIDRLTDALESDRSLDISADQKESRAEAYKKQFKGGTGKSIKKVTIESILEWQAEFIKDIHTNTNKLRGEYNAALNAGDNNYIQEFSLKVSDIRSEYDRDKDQILAFLKGELDDELEARKVDANTKDPKVGEEQEKRFKEESTVIDRANREAKFKIDDAIRPLKELEQYAGNAEVIPANGKGVSSEDTSGPDVTDPTFDFPTWLRQFIDTVQNYRLDQLSEYKNAVWPSGSKDASYYQALDIKRRKETFDIVYQNTQQSYSDEVEKDLDMDAQTALANRRKALDDLLEIELGLIDTLASVVEALDDPRKALKRRYIPKSGGGGSEEPIISSGPVVIPQGKWMVSVLGKDTAYSQRLLIMGVEKGDGIHSGDSAGAEVRVESEKKEWWINAQHQPTGNKWSGSKLKLSKNGAEGYTLCTEDSTDNDFNDLVLEIKKAPNTDNKSDNEPGVRLPEGNWIVRIQEKNAGFSQRLEVKGANLGEGIYTGDKPGLEVTVNADQEWMLRVDHNDGKSGWDPSQHRKSEKGDDFFVHTEDWTDNDFNDLILNIRPLKYDESRDRAAVKEMARFWGDPHLVGGDGGKSNVQVESD
jgi:hypothetical protein